MQKFEQCVKQVGISTNLGLRLDVATTWNSTYLMLESALQYEKDFSSLQLIDRNYSICLNLIIGEGQKNFWILGAFL